MQIPINLKSQKTITVESKHSAKTLGSGSLEVFGTPAMIALMENVAAEMIRPYLHEGTNSVGTMINANHLKASKIGAVIICKATVSFVDGKKVSYDIECIDETGDIIGTSKHDRFIIDIDKFLGKL